ncbi:Hcp transcriptional regulator HcpR (Crp/Fnr family) [Olavius algarvensis associated proteobacterium Delta 3]|nr:Hcp transcriptional regulator HcpR (Crp/Fnr family) [Olavius algarvensis associated proteobacterium Delta 3]CAB5162249.1 Hcp transcriptional regulator HcpR (Crp/Fnr family) [Olavius algarvensis associated proteobacterium Delta 3]
MKKNRDIIASVPLFRRLTASGLEALEKIVEDRRYPKGAAIFMEGDNADGFYIVAGGQVKIFKLSLEGKEHILHIFGPGHPFGEVPMFSGGKFPANAQSTRKSRLLYLPKASFIRLITSNPQLCLNMLADLSLRLRQFTIQIENLSLKEVPGRLASYLIYLADEQGNPDAVSLNISKGQLASLLGTIPETLSRIFAKMTGDGLIRVQGREIRLMDVEGLRVLADTGKL